MCEGKDRSMATYIAVISRNVESILSVKILKPDDQGKFSLPHGFTTLRLRLTGVSGSWLGRQLFREEGNIPA